ncbi:MAG: gluconokinase [Bacteroidota bacterium]
MNSILIVMGVSGSGKSTIAKRLSMELGISFYDADDFHPIENINKMKRSKALTDADRKPWLEILSMEIKKWEPKGAVLACSALKEAYRQILTSKIKCTWVYLKISESELHKRFNRRTGHFMPATLIHSQFNTLEEPDYGIHVDGEQSIDHVIHTILQQLK